MTYDASQLFDKAGYIPVKDYLKDINEMRKHGPWKLPLNFFDKVQLFLLGVFVKVSKFSDRVYILHKSDLSPAYTIIVNYLKKKNFFDGMSKRPIYNGGGYAYYFIKRFSETSNFIEAQGLYFDKASALSKSIGELVERMITGAYDTNKKILFASYESLSKKEDVFYPPKFHRFLSIQKDHFEKLRNSPSEVIAWVEGLSLVTGRKVFIPRSVTLWFMGKRERKEVLMHATTSGAAAYFTKEVATLNGLLEEVERDAFFVHWLTKTPPKVIKKETLPHDIQNIIKEIESGDVVLYVLDVTTLGIPSVVIIATNTDTDKKPKQVTMSASADLTFNEAIKDGLREIRLGTGMFHYVNDEEERKYQGDKFKPFLSDIGKIGRQLFWKGDDKFEQFKWFISGEEVAYDRVCTFDVPNKGSTLSQLEACLRILKARGEDYYPVVYYPKNKVQEELGFYAVQVFIPKAFPMYLVEMFGTYDSDRLHEFADSVGKTKWEVNTLPHMFS